MQSREEQTPRPGRTRRLPCRSRCYFMASNTNADIAFLLHPPRRRLTTRIMDAARHYITGSVADGRRCTLTGLFFPCPPNPIAPRWLLPSARLASTADRRCSSPNGHQAATTFYFGGSAMMVYKYSPEVSLDWGNFHDGEPSAACSKVACGAFSLPAHWLFLSRRRLCLRATTKSAPGTLP